MEPKLKFIKRFIIYLVFIYFVSSCGAYKKININKEEENFVFAYKKAVLYGCINEATNNNLSLFCSENNDLGLAFETEIIHHEDVINAVNKGKLLSKKIRIINYEDFEGKKPIFSDCINFAFSTEIDSIARVRFKIIKNE